MWARKPGFPTLVHVILEQQVSPASAKPSLTKLKKIILTATPEKFPELSDYELKKIGFSRQKTSYCRELALAILNKEIDLGALDSMNDSSARSTLMKVEGIGPWTADIYLLMALLRPDIWLLGDLALASAIQELKGLSSRPDREELDRTAISWRLWRTVAARLLWHYYIGGRNNTGRSVA